MISPADPPADPPVGPSFWMPVGPGALKPYHGCCSAGVSHVVLCTCSLRPSRLSRHGFFSLFPSAAAICAPGIWITSAEGRDPLLHEPWHLPVVNIRAVPMHEVSSFPIRFRLLSICSDPCPLVAAGGNPGDVPLHLAHNPRSTVSFVRSSSR